jgi:presenilin-like A22 family membrane protease
MKHSSKVTFILLGFFLIAQFVGLGIVYNYIDVIAEDGNVQFKDLPIGERPALEEGTSYIPIILAILIGTVIMLFLLKRRLTWIWKAWFFLAILLALIIAFTAFVPASIALVLALLLTIWKLFKPNFWVQNGTELFIYGGLAAIFVPILNLVSVSVLLVLIAIYDAYAVWKSKHMITLAKAQTDAKMFAGLMIPYAASKKGKIVKAFKKSAGKSVKKIKVRTAVLGGGDIGFPLIFAGVVMKELGVWQSFIGAGCFLGLLVVLLVGMV